MTHWEILKCLGEKLGVGTCGSVQLIEGYLFYYLDITGRKGEVPKYFGPTINGKVERSHISKAIFPRTPTGTSWRRFNSSARYCVGLEHEGW